MGEITLKRYRVGDVYEEFKTGDMLAIIDYMEGSGWLLAVGYPNMTDQEVVMFSSSTLQSAFTVINDRLFLLAKFGSFPWLDTPFEPARYPNPQNYPYFEDGKGINLTVLVVNTATGMVRHIRVVGLSNPMSNHLHAVCRDMDKRHRPFDNLVYEREVKEIYDRYPSSDAMLRSAKKEDITILAREV